MHASTLALAVTLLLACGSTVDVVDWPGDVQWLEEAELRAGSPAAQMAQDVLEHRMREEHTMMLASDMVVLGQVTELSSYERESGEIRTAITIEVEQCLKGDCECEAVTAHMSGGSVNGRATWMAGWGSPKTGGHYVFCLRRSVKEPGVLFGGYPVERFEVRDGVVLRKGMAVSAFLEICAAHLQQRSAPSLMKGADAAVIGLVTDYVSSHRSPPPDAHVGDGMGNFAEITVERVLKGDLVEASSLRVALPYTRGAGADVPRFIVGERILMFLCLEEGREWRPFGGEDSRVGIRQDGSLGRYSTVEALMAEVPGQ